MSLTETMTETEISTLKEQMNAIPWWHHIDLGPELGVTPGTEPAPRSRDSYMQIPWEEIKGKRVLDIGTWDGLYAFEAERAGALAVTAIDLWTEKGSGSHTGLTSNRAGFDFAHRILNSKVVAAEFSVYDLTKWKRIYESLFDYVFFFGVLYHLLDPMRALNAIHHVMKPGALLITETALDTSPLHGITVPYMRFCEGSQGGDPTNWWYPNPLCVESMLRVAGFKDVRFTGGTGGRGAFHARA